MDCKHPNNPIESSTVAAVAVDDPSVTQRFRVWCAYDFILSKHYWWPLATSINPYPSLTIFLHNFPSQFSLNHFPQAFSFTILLDHYRPLIMVTRPSWIVVGSSCAPRFQPAGGSRRFLQEPDARHCIVESNGVASRWLLHGQTPRLPNAGSPWFPHNSPLLFDWS